VSRKAKFISLCQDADENSTGRALFCATVVALVKNIKMYDKANAGIWTDAPMIPRPWPEYFVMRARAHQATYDDGDDDDAAAMQLSINLPQPQSPFGALDIENMFITDYAAVLLSEQGAALHGGGLCDSNEWDTFSTLAPLSPNSRLTSVSPDIFDLSDSDDHNDSSPLMGSEAADTGCGNRDNSCNNSYSIGMIGGTVSSYIGSFFYAHGLAVEGGGEHELLN
jgi:hypothetical protein